jgi:arylsulfatase A-like enzyme
MFLYDANLLYVDDLIGRLLTTLDQLKLRDNTIVVFLADHGEAFGEHGAYHHERVAYQEMTHVPVAIRLPARLASSPQLRPEVLSPLDFMPTFLDLFQLPPPETMQGRSRLLLLAGEQENEPAFAVSRARGDDWTGGVDRPAQVNYAFRDNDNTLILGNLGQQVELYHHGKDPREQDNLAQAQPRLLKQLRRRFQQWTETQRVRPPVLKGGTLYASEARRGTMDEKTKQQLENLGYLK